MSINILIPIQTLISSGLFIKIPMPIIYTAVLILFQRSFLRAWKKLNSFQLFPVSRDFYVIFFLKQLPEILSWDKDQSREIQSPDGDPALGNKTPSLNL